MRRFLGMLEIRAITCGYNNKWHGKAYTLFEGGQHGNSAYFRTRSVDFQLLVALFLSGCTETILRIVRALKNLESASVGVSEFDLNFLIIRLRRAAS